VNRKSRRAGASRARKPGSEKPDTSKQAVDAKADLPQAIAAYQAGDPATAARICRALVAAKRADATCYHLLGVAEGNLGRNDEAAAALAQACTLEPRNAEIWIARGLVEKARDKKPAAIEAFRTAISIDPASAAAHTNLGGLLMLGDDPTPSIAHFRAAIASNPDFGLAYANLAAVLLRLSRFDEAIPMLREAVRAEPKLAMAHCNLGFALRRKGYTEEARASFRKALDLVPDYAEAMTGYAICLALNNETEEATALLKRALEIKPEYTEASGQYLHELRLICDWPEVERWKANVDRANEAALAKGERPPETAFGHLIGNMDAAMNLRIARAAADEIAKLMAAHAPRFQNAPGGDPAKRLRIGYLSSDLREHAVGQISRRLFGLHDRRAVEVFCYSTGQNDGSAIRRQIEAESDRFVDIIGEDFVTSARRIRQDGIDILVDLNGWTAGNRLEIMALRPAPIQATWLGYPGTTGADFIDYLIADPVIAPPEDQPHFAERLCLLPDCYMVTDDQQPIEARDVTRAEFSLPEQGFVFSSFNNGYKIEPVVFGAWMRILAAVPGSVLWLSALNISIQKNLFAAASAAGIEPNRIIFAPRVDKPLHIKRVGLAGLGLDTLVFNGHSTTADTLWGGAPVLTLRGRHFASRVTASLLTSLGLDECICSDVEQYVHTAIALAQDPARLAALRAMLVRNRIEKPLFHTRHFVRNLESAYRAMWQRHAKGEVPATLTIARQN